MQVAPSRWRQVLNEITASLAHSEDPVANLLQQYVLKDTMILHASVEVSIYLFHIDHGHTTAIFSSLS
jgi:hypothetical protein